MGHLFGIESLDAADAAASLMLAGWRGGRAGAVAVASTLDAARQEIVARKQELGRVRAELELAQATTRAAADGGPGWYVLDPPSGHVWVTQRGAVLAMLGAPELDNPELEGRLVCMTCSSSGPLAHLVQPVTAAQCYDVNGGQA
jgi:hypothetical protein